MHAGISEGVCNFVVFRPRCRSVRSGSLFTYLTMPDAASFHFRAHLDTSTYWQCPGTITLSTSAFYNCACLVKLRNVAKDVLYDEIGGDYETYSVQLKFQNAKLQAVRIVKLPREGLFPCRYRYGRISPYRLQECSTPFHSREPDCLLLCHKGTRRFQNIADQQRINSKSFEGSVAGSSQV